MQSLYQFLDSSGINDALLTLSETGAMPIIIAVFGFLLILSIAVIYNPKDKLTDAYQKLNNNLIEKKKVGWFDYNDIKLKNQKNGISFYYPVLANPIIYTGVKICLGAFLCIPAISVHLIAGIFAFIVGYKLLDIYFFYKNNADNEKLTLDIQFIYNTLSIQIKGGVYIMDAICESYEQVNNKRLKQALMELSGEIMLKADSREAIEHFQNKFNNKYIDSLCVAIIQSLNSGKAIDLLADISEQIKTFQESIFKKKKTMMDTAMTFTTLILFSDAVAFVLYIMVTGLIKEASFI